jgi:hypothetical protein
MDCFDLSGRISGSATSCFVSDLPLLHLASNLVPDWLCLRQALTALTFERSGPRLPSRLAETCLEAHERTWCQETVIQHEF